MKSRERDPKQEALRSFRDRFGRDAEATFQAPGRVNLIGEHTDYNDGFVLPCAIDCRIVIAARPRADRLVRMVAANFGGQESSFDLDEPILPDARAPWSNYVRGVAVALLGRGHALRGVDMAVAGNVPLGAGLSSSAALEVVTGTLFNRLNDLAIDGTTLALVGQQAENEFVGINCGIMDQLISVLGKRDHALLIDCRSLEARPVRIPDGTSIVIINSNVQRGLVDSEYNTRRAQCEAAAAHFGVDALRDIDTAEFERGRAGLDDVTMRRARHVISENRRTLDAARALAEGDLTRMGELMAASHFSMRDDFEITVPSVDRLVEIVGEVIGAEGGVRMTGGGFGGCVVALVPEPLVGPIQAAVAERYPAVSGLEATVYVCRASDGAAAAAG
ncbi:MAG: galactokinase [Candidatus Palauibacterales bacterium]|nr:galactokinase [Candidatus Palauibacterales bacterium]